MTHTNRSEKNSLPSQHVVLINSGSLLDEGIYRLIQSETDFNVSTIEFTSNNDTLVSDIVSRQPEVVVMGGNRVDKVESLYKQLTSFAALSKLRMVFFHTEDNALDVFSQEKHNFIPCADSMTLVQVAHPF